MAINYPKCEWNLTESYIEFLVKTFNISEKEAVHSIASIDCARRSYTYLSESFVTALIALYCVVVPLGLIGNGIVIFTIGTSRNLQTSSNVLLFGMSVSDLILTITLPWSLIRNISYNYNMGQFLCHVIPTLQGTVVFSVIFILVGMAVERHRAIVYPFKRRYLRKNSDALLFLIGIWTFTLLFNLPQTVVLRDSAFSNTTTLSEDRLQYTISGRTCTEMWSEKQSQIYSIIIVIIGYLIPLALLTGLYYSVGSAMWFRRVMVNNITGGSVKRHYQQRRRRVILLISLVVAFAVLWGPYFIIQCTLYYAYDPEVLAYIQFVGHTNVAINPILYAVFHERLRSEFLAKIKCCCRKRSVKIASNNSVTPTPASQDSK